MNLQQIKYIVAALAIIQIVITISAVTLIVKHVVVGIRKKDNSKYRRAAFVFFVAFGLFAAIGIIQFFILLE